MIPCAEMVRFLKGGAEANSAALRMARAYTGRDLAVTCGYRGWHDQWAVLSRLVGIPNPLEPLTVGFQLNDLASLRAALEGHPDQVAAVIIDPVAKDEPMPGFLEGVRELTHRHGAVLIFDEIVTGFRVAKGGAQERYGVVPDLAVFAKGIANGMPLSAVVGHRDLMKAGDRISLTYGDEALSLAAAKAALSEQLARDVCGHIWRVGQALMDGLQAAISATGVPFEIGAIAPMASFVETDRFQGRSLVAEDRQRAWLYLLAELARRGVIHRRNSSFLLSYSHTDQDVDQVVSAFEAVFAELAELLASGKLREQVAYRPTPAFRRL
jgi:glutamate-1-semialdehyde aminotransferase